MRPNRADPVMELHADSRGNPSRCRPPASLNSSGDHRWDELPNAGRRRERFLDDTHPWPHLSIACKSARMDGVVPASARASVEPSRSARSQRLRSRGVRRARRGPLVLRAYGSGDIGKVASHRRGWRRQAVVLAEFPWIDVEMNKLDTRRHRSMWKEATA